MAEASGHRFTPQRKHKIIAELRTGLLTREATLKRWDLSEEELSTWECDFDARGIGGLKVSNMPKGRPAGRPRRVK